MSEEKRKTKYKIVMWPKSQILMELDGFKENCCLANSIEFIYMYGYQAYFCNEEWLNKKEEEMGKLQELLKKYFAAKANGTLDTLTEDELDIINNLPEEMLVEPTQEE